MGVYFTKKQHSNGQFVFKGGVFGFNEAVDLIAKITRPNGGVGYRILEDGEIVIMCVGNHGPSDEDIQFQLEGPFIFTFTPSGDSEDDFQDIYVIVAAIANKFRGACTKPVRETLDGLQYLGPGRDGWHNLD